MALHPRLSFSFLTSPEQKHLVDIDTNEQAHKKTEAKSYIDTIQTILNASLTTDSILQLQYTVKTLARIIETLEPDSSLRLSFPFLPSLNGADDLSFLCNIASSSPLSHLENIIPTQKDEEPPSPEIISLEGSNINIMQQSSNRSKANSVQILQTTIAAPAPPSVFWMLVPMPTSTTNPSPFLPSIQHSAAPPGILPTLPMPPKQRKRRYPVAEFCHSCGTNLALTPEIRRGPNGPNTLCNACGLYFAKVQKKQTITLSNSEQ